MRIVPYSYLDNDLNEYSQRFAALLLVITLFVSSSPCSARAYRCTDTQGSISYSQTPCTASQTGAKMHGVGTIKVMDREACTHVRSFASESFTRLKRGAEPSRLIDTYGGPGYINPLTLNIINFVSGFRLSKDVAAMKISGMAYNKCINGGFGKLQTSHLPPEILPPDTPEPESSPTSRPAP